MPILAPTPRTHGQQLADLGVSIDLEVARLHAEIADLRAEVEELRTQLPNLNAHVTTITATTALLQWDPVPGTTGYQVGRDGTDNRGAGPWSTLDPATATSRTFVYLTTGTEYHLTVTAQPSGLTATIPVTPA